MQDGGSRYDRKIAVALAASAAIDRLRSVALRGHFRLYRARHGAHGPRAKDRPVLIALARPTKRLRSAPDCFSIADYAEWPFGEFSGSQRQLVIFARARVAEADILVLDEPTSALDLENQSPVLERISALARNDGADDASCIGRRRRRAADARARQISHRQGARHSDRGQSLPALSRAADAHRHDHDDEVVQGKPLVPWHEHAPLIHAHSHMPDMHHRYGH